MKPVFITVVILLALQLGCTPEAGLETLPPPPFEPIPTNTPTISVLGAPWGDYGDAPDSKNFAFEIPSERFPSLLASDGARTLDIFRFWLGGPCPSLEEEEIVTPPPCVSQEENSLQVDLDDLDDGLQEIAFSDGTMLLTFRAEKSNAAAAGVIYFNLLADLNNDGRWTINEHVVANRELDFAPGGSEEFEVEVELPDPVLFWIRATVTDTPVPTGWVGTGEFRTGEVEDYWLSTAPEPALTFTDEPEDTFTCDTGGLAPGEYPAADIEEVQILSRGDFMEILVRLAKNPMLSFEEEFSWAVLVIKRSVDGTEHAFLAEIHDGEVRLGEFDLATGEVVPGTGGVLTFGEFVLGFAISQAFTDTADVLVLGFNLPKEGDIKGCDEAGPFELQEMAGDKPQVTRIDGTSEPVSNTEVKVSFTVTAVPPGYTMCGTITRPDGEVREGCITDEDGDGVVVFSHITTTPGRYEFEVTSINGSSDFLGIKEQFTEWH